MPCAYFFGSHCYIDGFCTRPEKSRIQSLFRSQNHCKTAKRPCYTDKGCRYGEPLFEKLEYQIKNYAPLACVYPGPYKPQFLYLALISGASLRAGFDCVREYPFLNISLHQLKTISPARMMARYFIKEEKDAKEAKESKG